MKKIIGLLRPFDVFQDFYVYEDGNKLDIAKTKIKDIPDTVLDLAQQYQVIEIDLSSSKHFSEGIIKAIQKAEYDKYGENKLIIKNI